MAAARILVNATSGLGENLLAVPFLRALRRALPDGQVSVAVRFDAAREIFERMSPVERVLVLDRKRYGTPGRIWELIRELRASRFDWCFNLVPANKAIKNIFARLAGANRIVSHAYSYAPLRNLRFLATDLAPLDPAKHDVEQNLSLLQAAGLEVEDDLQLSFPVTGAEREWAAAELAGKGPVLGLHVGSSDELGMLHKRWPVQRFAQLAGRLHREEGLTPMVFGGPGEERQAIELAKEVGGTAATGLSLGRLAALLANCRLFASNDSFPMHLAAAAGAPVVGIFGPTDPARTRPWSPRSRVVRLELDCSPCWNGANIGRPFRCTNPQQLACIGDLDVERVTAACRELLGKS